MDYLTEHCLFQALFLGLYKNMNEGTVLDRLAPLYVLNDSDLVQLQEILSNDSFQKLSSSVAVTLHENFIESFCIDENEFGCTATEWDALGIKRDVFSLFDNLASNVNDFHDAISTAASKSDRLTVILALIYYISDAKSDIFIPLLRRAEGHGNAEAAILLMWFEESRKLTLYDKLCNNKELLINNDGTLDRLAIHYQIENIKGANKDD